MPLWPPPITAAYLLLLYIQALVIITDGELTSGNYLELDTSLYELAVMKVFNYIVKEGDIVNEGVHKLASKPEDYFIFDITPNAMTSRFATQALTGGICLGKYKTRFKYIYDCRMQA